MVVTSQHYIEGRIEGQEVVMGMMMSFCRCIVVLCIRREWHRLQNAAMVATLLLNRGPVSCEAELHKPGMFVLCHSNSIPILSWPRYDI